MANMASNQQIYNSNKYIMGTQGNMSHANMDTYMTGSNFDDVSEQQTADMLSSEIKKIRLRISDYYRSAVIEPILFKLWKLMIQVQYSKTLLKAVSHLSHIPIATEVYQKIMPIYEIALGVYYQSSYYVAKAPIYKSETVFFERFCYDFVSLLGVNILFLEIEQLELIIRKVYSHVSYNFSGMNEDGGIQLRDYSCIDSAFQEEVFVKVK